MSRASKHTPVIYCHWCSKDLGSDEVKSFITIDGIFYCDEDCHYAEEVNGDYITSPASKWLIRKSKPTPPITKHPFLLC